MAKRKGNTENLVPQNLRTKEEQREIARLGGIASGEARKEKKLMSQILADYLQKEHEVVLRDDEGAVIDRSTLAADKLIENTITAVMARGDSASVQMMKTLGELTEGKNVNLAGTINVKKYDLSKLSTDELSALENIGNKVAPQDESD